MRSRFNVSEPFDPMFDEAVVLTGPRPSGASVRLTLGVCVLSDAMAEPVSDISPDSDADAIVVFIRDADWPTVEKKAQIGDTLERADGKRYSVTAFSRDNFVGNAIHARSA